MKLITLFSLCFLFILPSYAQEKQDTTKKQKEFIILSGEEKLVKDSSQTTKKDNIQPLLLIKSKESVSEKDSSQTTDAKQFFFIGKKNYVNTSIKINGNNIDVKPGHSNKFEGHWGGFYYGFINFVELPKSHDYLKLDWGGSFAMQFNIASHSIECRNNFGFVTGIGLEYQRLKFNDDNSSIRKAGGDIVDINILGTYTNIAEIRRSTFKTLYLTVPLLMEVQFPASNKPSERIYLTGGIMGGVRLHSKTKIVYNDKSGDKQKKKNNSNFNIVPVKADLTTRIGYKSIFAWGSYSLTNLFSADNIPDLHLYTIGVGIAL